MITQIAQSGSNRVYTREQDTNGKTYIRVKGTSQAENHAFITLARHFHAKGLPVPEVYDVSKDETEYTQEDLGDTLLFDYIRHGRETGCFNEQEQDILKRTIRQLAHIQAEGAQGIDWEVCYPIPSFDRRSVFWDLNYFKYCFLKMTGIEFAEEQLEHDFESMAGRLLSYNTDTFLYRDFQSRNVMVVDKGHGPEPYFIDFQGGRRGPIYYDLASFLWQAKARYTSELREALIEEYKDELSTVSQTEFDRQALNHFVLFRTLQVLGAYGYRGLHERKQHFIESIPYAIENMNELFAQCEELKQAYPYIAYIAGKMKELYPITASKTKEQTANDRASGDTEGKLQIDIYSFSFKKGVPSDPSGNGGGYVFDCRGTHNPGKYEQYKQLTGLDQPVIDFLEQDGEIVTFLNHAWQITDHHVQRFIERGFTHLQIAFGCTGGQHRSVYCAEKTAEHIMQKYGSGGHIDMHLVHRERGIERKIEVEAKVKGAGNGIAL